MFEGITGILEHAKWLFDRHGSGLISRRSLVSNQGAGEEKKESSLLSQT